MVLKRYEKLILVVVLLIAFFINGFYGNYKYPIHGDEYIHLAQAQDIILKGKIQQVNPYFNYKIIEFKPERGFHIFLELFIFIFRDNFLFYFNFLKNVVFLINTFLIFYLAYKLSNKFYIGIFSSLFYVLLKSSLDIQGNLFLLPLSLGVSFLLGFLILFIFYLEKGEMKYLYSSLFVLFLSIFVYPLTFLLIFYTLIIYLLFNYKNEKIIAGFYSLIAVLILSVVIYFAFYSDNYIFLIGLFYSIEHFITFSDTWTPIQRNVSPIFYFGIVGFALSLIGFITILYKRQRSNEILIIWFIFSLFEFLLFYYFNFTLFIPFARLFYFYLILLCIFAGYGLYFALAVISKLSIKKNIKISVIVILILLVFGIQFYNFYQNAKQFSPNVILNDEIYDALTFIHESYGEQNVVIADGLMSVAVFPITNNYVLSLFSSNLNAGKREEQIKFFAGDCVKQVRIVKDNDVKLILTQRNLECDFLKPVYNKGIYVYEVV